MRRLTSLGCLAAALLSFGCQELPHRPRGHDVEVVGVDGLAQANPNDIAIPPVRVTDPSQQAPDAELRIAFQKALIQRRYSPLALEAVDRRVVDASYPAGDLREDAVLEIVVDKWDDSLWSQGEQIDAAVAVRLLDARSPEGRVLWEGKLARVLHGYQVDAGYAQRGEILQALCDRLAGDVLAALPARTTAPE